MHRFQGSRLTAGNEQGFVLVVALLLLLLLTIVGMTMSNRSSDEVNIAANDRLQKEALVQADGGTQLGANLLEENIACDAGFTGPAPISIGGTQLTRDLFRGQTKLNFYLNETVPPGDYPSDTNRHVRFPPNDSLPHTNLHFLANGSEPIAGETIQQYSGYEGPSYGAAGGGAQSETLIDSQHLGPSSSRSVVRIIWRHVVGTAATTCRY